MTIDDSADLARYVLYSGWIRSSTSTVKPEAFIPFPLPDLSVTCHLNLTHEMLWRIGHSVAQKSGRTCHGRADIAAGSPRSQNLLVNHDPVDGNANHVVLCGWPQAKAEQKAIALKLAAAAAYLPVPTATLV